MTTVKRTRALCVATVVVLAASLPLDAQAQAPVLTQATTPTPTPTPTTPTFEVASIKPSAPADPSNLLSSLPTIAPQPGGRFKATNLPLWVLISTAWELPDFRIDAGDNELMNAKYDIVAKTADGKTFGMKEVPALLKPLLIERFQLKTHMEAREMDLYDLVIARDDGQLGPEMKPSKSDCSNTDELNAQRAAAAASGDLSAMVSKPGEILPCTIAPNLAGGPMNVSMHGDGQEMKALVETLSQFSGRYVRDKTGLTGLYDFDFKLDLRAMLGFAQRAGVPVPPGAADRLPPSDGSSLMTAIKEQLGLELESGRGQVDVLIVDSVSAPSPD